MRRRHGVPTAGCTLVDRQERRASLQVCLQYECTYISFVLSLSSPISLLWPSLPAFALCSCPPLVCIVSPSFAPCCLCYSSLLCPLLASLPGCDQWLVCQYSVHPVWSWGDLAHCLWLHPSSSSFILLWNWIRVESGQELCGVSSYHCIGQINGDIFSLVAPLCSYLFVAFWLLF